jgi:hypothetical protein
MARAKKRYGKGAKDYKIDQVVRLCQREKGCTTADIMEHLGVSLSAARSLVHDVRVRRNVKMTHEWKCKPGRSWPNRYSVWRI